MNCNLMCYMFAATQALSSYSVGSMMNMGKLLHKSQSSIRALITNTPVYSSAIDISGEGLSLTFRRWATKKTAGSTKNGRDSLPKNLGVKKFGGEQPRSLYGAESFIREHHSSSKGNTLPSKVLSGNIIVRQRGTPFHPGNYVGIAKDHTLYALKEGCVKFEFHKLSGRKWVHVEPMFMKSTPSMQVPRRRQQLKALNLISS
ncbi:50S ribosomal L27-like [Olea europaea subsp. europaea]|uniref:50S ribosomal L27-like n=1 Tax=Olea europaea subsp. europaea TaxID=158383 RepID=A0A8S0P735_OLEEU|nr:50S ribosomal L27-like [Olea europaea subsp. europaea]